METRCRHCDRVIRPFDIEKTKLGSNEPSVIEPGWIHMEFEMTMSHKPEPVEAGVMVTEGEEVRGMPEVYEIGEPEFVGGFPIRQDITVLPADPPKGCMRIEDEVVLSLRSSDNRINH